jgi:hypothetical protein
LELSVDVARHRPHRVPGQWGLLRYHKHMTKMLLPAIRGVTST